MDFDDLYNDQELEEAEERSKMAEDQIEGMRRVRGSSVLVSPISCIRSSFNAVQICEDKEYPSDKDDMRTKASYNSFAGNLKLDRSPHWKATQNIFIVKKN